MVNHFRTYPLGDIPCDKLQHHEMVWSFDVAMMMVMVMIIIIIIIMLRLTHIEYILQNGKSLRRIPQWLFKCAVHHPLNREHTVSVSVWFPECSAWRGRSFACVTKENIWQRHRQSKQSIVGFTTTRLLVWLHRHHRKQKCPNMSH